MVFSTNQVRQFYVANDVKTTIEAVIGTDEEGVIALVATPDKKSIYFSYKGANNNMMRSDLIKLQDILHVKAVSKSADSQVKELRQAVVKLDSNVNSGNPIGGQDYILRLVITPYVGMSDEDVYIKYGVVHAVRNMKPGKFYTKLAASLYKNFSREIGKMFDFIIAGSVVGRVKTAEDGTETLIDVDGEEITVADTYADGVTIQEVEQEWTLGIKEQSNVDFKVIPTTVICDGEDVTWGTVKYEGSGVTRNNGRRIADLEYFCMGERGDQYRNIGWPNSIPTRYLVDSNKAYHILNIHFAFVDANEGPQRSERDLTIVCEDATKLNTIITALITTYNVPVEVVNKPLASSDTTLK